MTHNEEPRIFNNILSEEPSFEVMTGYLKAFSKIYQGRCKYKFEKQVLNWWMDFNDNEILEDLLHGFEDWLYRLCK